MIEKMQIESRLEMVETADPVILCAADDNYARPLTVTLHSAATHLAPQRKLIVFVLDGGISDQNWMRIKESLANLPIEIHAIRPSFDAVQSLAISHHITHTAYLRLLAGRLLPSSIDKVIYLDSDLLVQDDLSFLWDLSVGNNFALAVPDIACPFVDSRHADCNFDKSSPYFASLAPIGNWKSLGLDPSAPYFNSGVMVLNIDRMRRDGVEQKLLRCLSDNQKHVWCWDQYALNVVFANHWKPLPLRWNQGAHIYEYPDDTCSPINADEFNDALDSPAIIHFTTEWKAWDHGSQHPMKQLYFDELKQTAFGDWQPEKPPFKARKAWDQFAAEFVKRWVIGYRKTRSFFRPNRFASPASDLQPINKWMNGNNGVAPDMAKQVTSPRLCNQMTIFAIPKPFKGQADTIQRNAINSWKRLKPFANIILVGHDRTIESVATELDVGYIGNVRENRFGTPLVSAALESVRRHCTAPYIAYVNSDIILLDDFTEAMNRMILDTDFDEFLAIGRRTNLEISRSIDFDKTSDLQHLKNQVADEGVAESIVCKDYFVFKASMYSKMPEFAVGRGNWDNWMVADAKTNQIPVISFSDVVTAIHQQHHHDHVQGRLKGYWTGKEARINEKLAGGKNWIRGTTTDFKMTKTDLENQPGRSLAAEFWLDFPRFVRLVSKLFTD